MKDAEYYSTKGSADIDPSFCNFVPDAPRITALTKSNLSASDTDGDASDTKRKHSKERKPAAEVKIYPFHVVNPMVFWSLLINNSIT